MGEEWIRRRHARKETRGGGGGGGWVICPAVDNSDLSPPFCLLQIGGTSTIYWQCSKDFCNVTDGSGVSFSAIYCQFIAGVLQASIGNEVDLKRLVHRWRNGRWMCRCLMQWHRGQIGATLPMHRQYIVQTGPWVECRSISTYE